jgi:hypothetical protein
VAVCAPYGDLSVYGDGELYCSGVAFRGTSAVFYEALVQALSVEFVHDGFFQLDTIKPLVQDTKYAAAGYSVFPDLTGVTFLSVEVRTNGAFRLDAIRPVVRVLRKQLHG